MSDLTLDVDLAAKLKVAFARNGWTEQLIDTACKGDKLGQFRKVLLGHAVITPIAMEEHIINCDADPFVPDGWKVEEHRKGGQFKWDASKVKLYLSKEQEGGSYIEGNDLREEFKGQSVWNANLLDYYLLANSHLIPEEWKGKHVFFWGTIYRHSSGRLAVRSLHWVADRCHWHWGWRWLDDVWHGGLPAAVSAN